jgi:hypothetical protein
MMMPVSRKNKCEAERDPSQNREQQHLQDVSVGKSADERVGKNAEQEAAHLHMLPLPNVLIDGMNIERPRIDVHAGAGLQEVGGCEAKAERQRGDHLEIDQCLQAYTAYTPEISHPCDAGDDRQEDDRRHEHADELDKSIAQRLQLLREVGKREPDRDAAEYADHQAEIERSKYGGGP